MAALADELRALPWPPTLVIDSGNGLQPIWLLEVPIEGTPEYRAAAEELCARIEAALGAKGTHNVDRLLRVPGTRNYPNARKRKLGRVETQAKLLETEWQHYSWHDLEKLAEHLESNPPMHAVPLERAAPTKQKAPGTVVEVDLLPADTPDPLDDARLDELRASHPEVFDLANYDGDQSRQELALANVARKLGWPPVDAWALIVAVRGDAKATRRDYIARTLQKAYDEQNAPDGKGDALYDFSDDGLALDMGRKWQLGARHVALWRSWMFWDGTRWQRDETLLSHTRTREYLRARGDGIVRDTKLGKIKWKNGDEDPEKALAAAEALAKSLRAKNKVSAVVELARSNPELVAVAAQWDADPWQLNTPGGIIDLRTGVVMPHTPYAYHTKITAVAPGGACPPWLKFLDRVTGGNVQLQAYLKHSAGYALTGSTREHVLQFLYGTGANGKGVFLNTIVGIMADYARVATMETFTASTNDRHPTDLAMLRGARLVTAQETEQGRRWAEAKIKSLTGGDPITARFLYQDNFTFVPQFKLQIAGNHRPGLTGVDEAIRRRFHLVPFDQTIPEHERDHELSNKLKAEWPGILAWMLEGCLEWQKIGLSPPEIVRAATDNYLSLYLSL